MYEKLTFSGRRMANRRSTEKASISRGSRLRVDSSRQEEQQRFIEGEDIDSNENQHDDEVVDG